MNKSLAAQKKCLKAKPQKSNHLFFNKIHKVIFLKILAITIIIAVWVQLTYLPLRSPMMVNEADAYSRLWHIVYFPISNIWLPGFQFIMRLFSIILDNGSFLNYRLGIYFLTISLSLVIFSIIKNITNDFFSSLLGLIIFLFHPLTKQLSVVTLTEIPWLLFVFLSVYFLFFSKLKNKLTLGLLFFIISQTIRYESWFLLALLIPYLLFTLKTNYSKLSLVLVVSAFPILWMLVLNKLYGNPISFFFEKLNCSHGQDSIFYSTFKELLDFMILQINTYIFPSLFLILFLLPGLFYKRLNLTPISSVSVYLFLCFLMETFTTFNENMTPRFFYFLVPALAITIPVYLYHIYRLHKKFSKIFITAVYLFLFIYHPISKLNHNYYTTVNSSEIYDVEDILSLLKTNNPREIYLCTLVDDYFFSNFIKYRLYYQDLLIDCNNDPYITHNSSNIITSLQDESFYDSKIRYSNKIKFSNHILYSF